MKKTRLLILLLMLLFSLSLVSIGLAAGRANLPRSNAAVQAPALVFTKTVGTDPGICGPSAEITIVSGMQVVYCYQVHNSGTVTLSTHTLTDTQLGVLLNNAAIDLAPGGSMLITESATIAATTINTATWNARTTTGTAVLATDSARVNTQLPAISLNKTVGLSDVSCAATNSRSVEPGTSVTFCYEVTNTGPVTVSTHTLVDDQLGTLFSGSNIILGPGQSDQHLETVIAGTAVTNEGTWTATDAYNNDAVAADTATISLLAHSVTLIKTVNDTGLCGSGDSIVVQPGTMVTYCYEMVNNSPITLTSHTITDNQLGLLLIGDATMLPPAGSFSFSTTVAVTQTTVNTGIWTAVDPFTNNSVANDSATVTVLMPAVSLNKTVSVNPSTCQSHKSISVSSGTQVNYCFEITNTGPVTLSTHTLSDNQLGTLLSDQAMLLPPGQSFVVSQTAVINSGVVNTATLTSSEAFGNSAGAIDTASVALANVAIVLTKTVNASASLCAATTSIFVIPSTTVNYCYEIENTGTTTLTTHTLVDDQLGNLLTAAPINVPPGATALFSATAVITEAVTNIAVWSATDSFDNSAAFTSTATVNIIAPQILLTKTVGTDLLACSSSDAIAVEPITTVLYCFEIHNTGSVTLTTHTLTDTHLGVLFSNVPGLLIPGQTSIISQTALITNAVVNTATWAAGDSFSNVVMAQDSASVAISGVSVILTNTVSSIVGVCGSTNFVAVDPGQSVTFCLEAENTGVVSLTVQTLVDSYFGTLLNAEPLLLAPGATHLISQTIVITETVTNMATWTAWDMYGNPTQSMSSSTALALIPDLAVVPLTVTLTLGPNVVLPINLQLQNVGTDTINWTLAEQLVPGRSAPTAFGDEVFRVLSAQTTGHSIMLGVEYANGHFWVTSGGAASLGDPNMLLKLDSGGALVTAFPQGTDAAGFGWRDLAFDGNFLYASDSGSVVQIDPANGLPTGTSIDLSSTGLSLGRALAYDPATDHFWVGDFGSSLYEITRAGTVINAFVNPGTTMYGLAWDDVSVGGPYLWVWSDNPARATQINPSTGLATGLSFTGSAPNGEQFAGGATISDELIAGKLVLIGMHQGGEYPIIGYDLDQATGLCAPRNITWLGASPSAGSIAAGNHQDVTLTIDSTGLALGNHWGNLCIDSNDPDTPLMIVPVHVTVASNEIYLPIVAEE